MVIFLGYKTVSQGETPEVIYIGQSKSEGLAAADKSTFPRIEFLAHPTAYPVRGWTQDRADAHASAQNSPKKKRNQDNS